jgi:hypothetical protein
MVQRFGLWSLLSNDRIERVLKLGYTTIITSIRSCQAGALKQYLQEHVAPRFDPAKIIECQNSFPFDQIKGLHFCSLLIIHEADGSDPRLVFEATFDGLREEFVDDLLRVASQWIHKIYGRCEGYPKSGLAVPELIKSYLLANDAGVQTFFAGSPGRCVAQIKGEQRVHDEIVSFVSRRRSTKEAPTTFLGIQRELQHEVIRNRPANHWAEQPAAVPWEVSQRRGVLAAVVLAVSVVACWLGAGVLRWYGLRPTGVYDTIDILLRNAVEFGEKILSPEIIGPLIADLLNVLRVPILPPLMSLTVAWFCLRVVQLLLERDNPRDAFFLIRFVVHISVILRYAVLAFLAGFAVLLFDKRLVQTPGAPMWWHTLVYLCAVAVSLLLLKYFATTLKLVVQLQGLSPAAENVRRFLLDVVRFLMVILVIWVFVVLGLHIPAYITAVIGDFVFPGTKILLVVTIYVVVGILIFYCLAFLFFLLVRWLEFMDRIRFAPATDLPNRATASVFEREEGGGEQISEPSRQSHLREARLSQALALAKYPFCDLVACEVLVQPRHPRRHTHDSVGPVGLDRPRQTPPVL